MKTTPPKPKRRYQAQARIARALAHPSRLMILDSLARKERSVADLTRLVGADQSTVSKHLALLRAVGLVDSRRDGTTSYYRATCTCLSGFFDCLDSVLHADLKTRQACLTC